MKGQKTVLVGMSGGVDSSVAAALLRERGYRVIGCTMRLAGGEPSGDLRDAKRVAGILGIEHHVLDFTEDFRACVIEPFAEAYLQGRTPNPCILCNRRIKFGRMQKAAKELGCDYIATGHYAKIGFHQGTGRWQLRRADSRKDQSYVLYHLTQEQLSGILLPLCDYTKEQIRELAERYQLLVAQKPESQEICFVADNDYAAFIKSFSGKSTPPGDFIDEAGTVIGRHKGILHYTIGQRKGLGQSFGQHMFVSEIDAHKNTITLVTRGNEYFTGLLANDLNIIAYDKMPERFSARAMIRYQANTAKCTVSRTGEGGAEVLFDTPQRAVAPGQAVVFYDGDLVLGGGTITKGLRG